MKILDEKGKLFGKINVIDLLILLVVLAVLAVVATNLLDGNPDGDSPVSDDPSSVSSGVKCNLTYTVRVTAQREDVADQISRFVNISEGKKDQLMHNGALVEGAYVVDYWTEPCRYNVLNTGEVKIIGAAEADAAGLVDICLLVESVVEDSTTSLVGTQEVRIGKTHILKTTHIEFLTGVITDCEWEPIRE